LHLLITIKKGVIEMKNLFFILVATICGALTLQAQPEDSIVNQREHSSQYFLSEPFEDSCTNLDVFEYQEEFDITTCFKKNESGIVESVTTGTIIQGKIADIAQSFYVDTTLNIIGIAILSPYRYYLGRNGYLCIADSNLNIKRKTPIYDIPISVEEQHNLYQNWAGFGPNSQPIWWFNYEEFFFDTPINMIGKFYVILDNPKPNPYTGYNWNNIADRTNFHYMENIIAIVYKNNLCPTTMEPLIRYVQIHNPNMTIDDYYSMTADEQIQYSICKDTNAEVDFLSSDTIWHSVTTEPLSASIFEWYHSKATTYYLFPIFDTITPNIDSSALEKIDLENYTLVYPNPTNREVNVQCSFLIKTIEIYNSLGSMVKEITDIKANHYLLDLNAYEKGNYILRLNTNGGTIEKKILLQ
jgi:hypothetical protein